MSNFTSDISKQAQHDYVLLWPPRATDRCEGRAGHVISAFFLCETNRLRSVSNNPEMNETLPDSKRYEGGAIVRANIALSLVSQLTGAHCGVLGSENKCYTSIFLCFMYGQGMLASVVAVWDSCVVDSHTSRRKQLPAESRNS